LSVNVPQRLTTPLLQRGRLQHDHPLAAPASALRHPLRRPLSNQQCPHANVDRSALVVPSTVGSLGARASSVRPGGAPHICGLSMRAITPHPWRPPSLRRLLLRHRHPARKVLLRQTVAPRPSYHTTTIMANSMAETHPPLLPMHLRHPCHVPALDVPMHIAKPAAISVRNGCITRS
jgi:hypothetical protein